MYILPSLSSDIINTILISHHSSLCSHHRTVICEEATRASALSRWLGADLSQRRDVSLEPLVDGGGSVDWKGKRERSHDKSSSLPETFPPLSHFSSLLHLSAFPLSLCLSLFLSHCVSVSVLGGAGQARSVWFRAVSRRRIGSIYSLVCSGPQWPEVSVCFSLRLPVGFCRSVIHLSHISWSPLYLILPTDPGLAIASSPSSVISLCLTSSASLWISCSQMLTLVQRSFSFYLFLMYK